MYRVVSSLLILLVLASQSFCAAHSHIGTSVVEPEEHSTRPHVHLHGGKHHHGQHSHRKHEDSREESLAIQSGNGLVDHDSNALYFPETTLVNDVNTVKLSNTESSVACVIYDESTVIVSSRIGLEGNLPPPLSGLKCPLYLRTLSIRC